MSLSSIGPEQTQIKSLVKRSQKHMPPHCNVVEYRTVAGPGLILQALAAIDFSVLC